MNDKELSILKGLKNETLLLEILVDPRYSRNLFNCSILAKKEDGLTMLVEITFDTTLKLTDIRYWGEKVDKWESLTNEKGISDWSNLSYYIINPDNTLTFLQVEDTNYKQYDIDFKVVAKQLCDMVDIGIEYHDTVDFEGNYDQEIDGYYAVVNGRARIISSKQYRQFMTLRGN